MSNGIAQREIRLEICAVEHIADTMQIASRKNPILKKGTHARTFIHPPKEENKNKKADYAAANLGHLEQRADDPAIQPLTTKPSIIALTLALSKRHPEPARRPYATQSKDGAARAEPHEHSLDLIVGVVSRREDVRAAAHHRVEQ